MPTEISSKPLTRRERSIAAKYKKFLRAQARASGQYELADRLALQIAKDLGGDGKTARIAIDGRGIQVIDNYQAAIAKAKATGIMPKVWAHAAGRQYELKEVSVFNT
jgi:hypothetical protein